MYKYFIIALIISVVIWFLTRKEQYSNVSNNVLYMSGGNQCFEGRMKYYTASHLMPSSGYAKLGHV